MDSSMLSLAARMLWEGMLSVGGGGSISPKYGLTVCHYEIQILCLNPPRFEISLEFLCIHILIDMFNVVLEDFYNS